MINILDELALPRASYSDYPIIRTLIEAAEQSDEVLVEQILADANLEIIDLKILVMAINNKHLRLIENILEGNESDISELLEMLFKGHKIDEDKDAAKRWLIKLGDSEKINVMRRIAPLGDTDIMFYLGIMLARGEYENKPEAVSWYRQAAELGHSNAMYSYAWTLDNGEGIDENKAEAAIWYQKHEESKQLES